MESIQRGGKNNPYNGNFNNYNKTYLPARTTTLGYEKTDYVSISTDNLTDNSQLNKHNIDTLKINTQINGEYKYNK